MSKNSIQFFGLPGSGKTSCLKRFLNEHQDRYKEIPTFSKIRRFGLSVFFILCFPRISCIFLRMIIQNDVRLWKYLLHLISVSFAGHMYVILRPAESKTFLIDEGIFQRMLSVAPGAISEKKAQKLVNILGKVRTKIIIVHGGDFGRFTTEPDRMISPRNKLGPAYFKVWSENLERNFTLFERLIIESRLDHETIKGKTD